MRTVCLQTDALRKHALGPSIARALEAALHAVEPGELVRRAIGSRIRDQSLPPNARIIVAGAGKAGRSMAEALVETLGDRIVEGLVVIKADASFEAFECGPVRIVAGDHPVPGERSIAAGLELLAVARRAGPDDVVLCPISGGASALVTVPHDGITLADLAAVTQALLRSGADIQTLNCVRKHLDRIKGGGLALAAAPATVLTLVLSDVVGDPLDVIASGPTVGDTSTFEDAWMAVHAAMDSQAVAPSVRRLLADGRAGARPETPTPDDPRLARTHAVLLAGNGTAVEAAANRVSTEGMRMIARHALRGEAADAGRQLAARLPELFGAGPACIVAGGETTVTLRGNGVGGRNLELALAAVEPMAAVPGALLVTLATDGDDGPSGAAGAVVTSDTLARARARGLDVQTHLARNDSLAFFDALGDTIRTGPTGTNVCDLAILSWLPTTVPSSS